MLHGLLAADGGEALGRGVTQRVSSGLGRLATCHDMAQEHQTSSCTLFSGVGRYLSDGAFTNLPTRMEVGIDKHLLSCPGLVADMMEPRASRLLIPIRIQYLTNMVRKQTLFWHELMV